MLRREISNGPYTLFSLRVKPNSQNGSRRFANRTKRRKCKSRPVQRSWNRTAVRRWCRWTIVTSSNHRTRTTPTPIHRTLYLPLYRKRTTRGVMRVWLLCLPPHATLSTRLLLFFSAHQARTCSFYIRVCIMVLLLPHTQNMIVLSSIWQSSYAI